MNHRSSFDAVLDRLGPSMRVLPTERVHVPSAEQAAFRFSSCLLIYNDIIASTVRQEEPRLYDFHRGLLTAFDGTEPALNLETVIGCQNWALLHIGEIVALDAWKQKCKKAGNLDIIELVRRATVVKSSLEAHLARLESLPEPISDEASSLPNIFRTDLFQQSYGLQNQSRLTTRIWAHAALVYICVVISGWQPANPDVHYHVGRIVELLTSHLSPPTLIRTVVWPFCVAGCLAEQAQEPLLRAMVEALQPPSVFGTVRKALDIMENVWYNRDTEDTASRDLAACFRSQCDMILLV
jgi:C6 transcription factor Pro1